MSTFRDNIREITLSFKLYEDEIQRLAAELAAVKAEPGWTAIESVEQVEGLAAGFYELDGCVAVKLRCGEWIALHSNGCSGNHNNEGFIATYSSYKLIRAFAATAAPAIPKGAIENTDKNRAAAEWGFYLLTYGNSTHGICFKDVNGAWLSEVFNVLPANYFTKLNENEVLAALIKLRCENGCKGGEWYESNSRL